MEYPSPAFGTTPVEQALLDELTALREAAERYRIASAHSDEIVLDYDLLHDHIFHSTELVEEIYGLPQQLENALTVLAQSGVILPESLPALESAIGELKAGQLSSQCTLRTRIRTGELRWNRIVFTTIFDSAHRPVRAVGLLKDISLQREAELRYESELLYRDTMARNAILTYEVDLTNRRLMSGYEQITGLSVDLATLDFDDAMRLLVERLICPEDQPMLLAGLSARALLQQHALGNDRVEFEYRRLLSDGSPSWARGNIYLTDDRQAGTVRAFFYVQDINRAKLELLRLRDEAERDLLTGLYNKITTERMVAEAIALEPKGGTVGALMIIDLDDFKRANDELGHAFGDVLLSEAAQKLRGLCRRDDIAGRIGGDEFVLYLRALPDVETALRKAGEICDILQNAYSGVLGDLPISGSVGVALTPTHGDVFDELYRKADQALYEAKRNGKNAVRLYNPTDSDAPSPRPLAAIDRLNGKRFSEHVVEYILRILYESRDLRRAVDVVLELVSRHFGFSRGYLYEMSPDGRCCELTMEWRAPQVEPLPKALRRLTGRALEDCRRQLHGQNAADAHDLAAPWSAAFPPLPALRARLQQALTFDGKFAGFVGFDRYGDDALPAGGLPASLREVAQLLDVFLSERLAHDRLAEQQAILNALPDAAGLCCVYAVDAATRALRFTDHDTRERLPKLAPGAPCYRLLRGRASPCDDCPIDRMLAEKIPALRTELFLEPYNRVVQLQFVLLPLDNGRTPVLVTARDIVRDPT